MSNTNTAAWLKEVNTKFEVSETDLYIPAAGELLIENRAVAINPVDWMNQDGHYPPKSVPAILGNDLAGIVVQLGEGVHGFKEGQRVLAHSNAWADGDIRHGPFQKFVAVPAMSASQIPDSMEFAEAASLPLALSTAAIGLFSQAHLALPLPSAHVAGASTKALLVWGGSSSVGTAAIQLAKAAGLEVLVVTSAKNAKVAQQLGATMVYDYNSATVVEDLIKDAKQYDIVGAYDGKYWSLIEDKDSLTDAKFSHFICFQSITSYEGTNCSWRWPVGADLTTYRQRA